MKCFPAFALCAVCLASVTLLADDPPSDQEQLQGDWTLLEGETNGRPMSEALGDKGIKNFQVTFDGEVMKMSGQGKSEFTYRYHLDPSQNPKHFDSVPVKAPKEHQGALTVPGIYRLEGDKLTLCLANGREVSRPEELTASKGSRRSVLILKRVAKKTK